jgi:biopolymer transport protein ExbD
MTMRPVFMAACAGLFLILSVCVFYIRTPRGYMTKVAVKRADCGEGDRSIVVHVGRTGRASLNGEVLQPEELEHRLRDIFSRRAEKLVFVSADPEVPFALVARVIDLANGHVDHVALLTPTVQTAPGACLAIAMPPALDYFVPRRTTPVDVQEVPLWPFWR